MAEVRCVNDTNGDGDCAACARNPNAPCRQCVGCRLTGRCAEHPANGRLSLVDCAAEFRELYGDDAEDAALRLHRRLLPAQDWRFMVEYGPHPDGDPRNGRVTFHDGATAEHVATYLEREHITLTTEVTDG